MRRCPVTTRLLIMPLALATMGHAATALAAGDLRITGAWIRSLGIGTIPAAGYFTLENDTDAAVDLTGAASPDCARLTLHQTLHQIMRMHTESRTTAREPADAGMPPMNGPMDRMTTMQPVASLAVPPHGSVRFAPGSYHLMCEGASPRIRPGASITISLQFAGGRTLDHAFTVRGVRSP